MRPSSTRTAPLLLALGLLLLLPLLACSDDGGDDQVESGGAADVVAELPDRAREFVNAVFRVETEGCGWIGSGSGFAIDAHHVVTNHHVVANDSAPIVRTQAGTPLRGRVIGSTRRPDLAVIQLDEELPTTVAWADTSALQPREPLVVMGFPVPDRTFKISTGEVVAFQPPNTREALIANNPIDRGNSGGPALRRDGTVAGVVTEMATRDDDGQRVAIVFTTASVRRVAQGFIDSPAEVLSSCGLGPDYVPEVPTDFDLPPITEIPEPPAQPGAGDLPDGFTPSSLGTLPPAPSSTTSTRPPCPIDPVSIRADAVDVQPVGGSTDRWRVRARGTVANNAPVPIEILGFSLRGQPDPPGELSTSGVPSANPLGPFSATAWSDEVELTSATRPVPHEVAVGWTYTDGAYLGCPMPVAAYPIEVVAQAEPSTTTSAS